MSKYTILLFLSLFINAAAVSQDSNPRTDSDLSAKLETIMQDLVQKKKKMNRDYALAMKNIGWPTILDFRLLKKNSDIVRKQEIARKAVSIIRTHRNKITAFKAYSRNALENIELSADKKRVLLAGYDQGTRSKNAYAAKRYWELEEKVAGDVKTLIDLLAANQSAWYLDNGRLEFNDKTLIDRYNHYIDLINRSIAQQNRIRRSGSR